MNEAISSEYIQSLLAEKKFHSRIIEMFFLLNDEEVGDLTWKIAALQPEKRDLLRQIIEAVSRPN